MKQIKVDGDWITNNIKKLGIVTKVVDGDKLLWKTLDFEYKPNLLKDIGFEVEQFDPYDDYHQVISADFVLEDGKYTLSVYDDYNEMSFEIVDSDTIMKDLFDMAINK